MGRREPVQRKGGDDSCHAQEGKFSRGEHGFEPGWQPDFKTKRSGAVSLAEGEKSKARSVGGFRG